MARLRDQPAPVDRADVEAADRLLALWTWWRLQLLARPHDAGLLAVERAAAGPGTAAERIARAEQVLDLLDRRGGFETFARSRAEARRRWHSGPRNDLGDPFRPAP